MANTRGLLVCNLGTPASTDVKDVRAFLREFLSDPRVLDMNPVGRWMLLNLIILPFRPKKSAEAYSKIWTDEGSPILVHSREFESKLSAHLGDDWVVRLGMRYGDPSMETALRELVEAGVEEVVFLPLYPQYALSSTETSIERFKALAETLPGMPSYRVVENFYDHEGFCAPSAALASEHLGSEVDHVLFSFHGLPVHQVQATDPTGEHCGKSSDCCKSLCEANQRCYGAQSHVTAQRLAEKLGLEDGTWSVAFQSRLTKVPWLEPATDKRVLELAEQGTKHLAIMCPSFVADNLETLEEINMQAREEFLEAGGESFHFVPCLNARADWIAGVAAIVQEA